MMIKRRDQAQQDVKVEPVPGAALPAQPCPTQTNRVEVDEQEQKKAEHPEVQADRSARLQQCVLRRKGALFGGDEK